MTNVDNFLAHYGVKGMRWGVRRGLVSPGVARTNKETKVRSTRKDALRRRQTLSDKNLDQLVKRLEQEKKLKALLQEDLSPGRTATKKLLSNSGTKVAGLVATGVGVWAVRNALTGGFSDAVKPVYAINAAGQAAKKFNKGAAINLAKDLASTIPKPKK